VQRRPDPEPSRPHPPCECHQRSGRAEEQAAERSASLPVWPRRHGGRRAAEPRIASQRRVLDFGQGRPGMGTAPVQAEVSVGREGRVESRECPPSAFGRSLGTAAEAHEDVRAATILIHDNNDLWRASRDGSLSSTAADDRFARPRSTYIALFILPLRPHPKFWSERRQSDSSDSSSNNSSPVTARGATKHPSTPPYSPPIKPQPSWPKGWGRLLFRHDCPLPPRKGGEGRVHEMKRELKRRRRRTVGATIAGLCFGASIGPDQVPAA
jgi:hypothetical protein